MRWPRSPPAIPASSTRGRSSATPAVTTIERYAYYRVGYHRGLDALRANGWRGSGYVRWSSRRTSGFLRAARRPRRDGRGDRRGRRGRADRHLPRAARPRRAAPGDDDGRRRAVRRRRAGGWAPTRRWSRSTAWRWPSVWPTPWSRRAARRWCSSAATARSLARFGRPTIADCGRARARSVAC